MSAFKKGDKVRVIDPSGNHLADINDIGEVVAIDEDSVDGDLLTVKCEQGKVIEMFAFRFELIQALQALAEDPVLVYLDRLKGSEVRMKDVGGSEKGQKSSQMAAMDPLALLYLGEVSGMGAAKYAAFNYLQSGYDWRLSMDAALRHLMAFWAGQDADSESELLHVAHAAWHCLALVSFQLREIGTDTRFKQGAAA